MSKVYLHDDATGVTVESVTWSSVPITVTRKRLEDKPMHLTPAEFRAVIEGGLRWVEENSAGLTPDDLAALRWAIGIVRGR